MSAAELLLLRRDVDGICTLTLNRPAQFNALSEALLGELQSALDAIAADAAVRVVVLAGAGKAFCAGHDLKEMRAAPDRATMQALFKRCARVMLMIQQMPQPVIARVHGVATAAGCQLVATCDLAVAVEGARFAVSGINVGLFCSTPAVALSRAALDARVEALCRSIIGKSAAAVAMGKRAFYRQLEMGIEGAYQLAGETMACNMDTHDALHGIDCFMARQTPTWQGR